MAKCGDYSRRGLFIAYDDQQPPAWADALGEIASTFRVHGIVFDMFSRVDGLQDLVSKGHQLDVLGQDLLMPYTREEDHSGTLAIGCLADDLLVFHDAKDACCLGWRGAVLVPPGSLPRP